LSLLDHIITNYIWGFLPKLGVPQIIHFDQICHCKPSILGYHRCRKPIFVVVEIPTSLLQITDFLSHDDAKVREAAGGPRVGQTNSQVLKNMGGWEPSIHFYRDLYNNIYIYMYVCIYCISIIIGFPWWDGWTCDVCTI
jgi:hypothetical protein